VKKIGELLKPINLLRLLVACSAIGISSLNLFILRNEARSTLTTNRLNMITQLLFIIFFVLTGIEGLKDGNKGKRIFSYLCIVFAIFMMFTSIRIYLKYLI
jgi:hypothetical protein